MAWSQSPIREVLNDTEQRILDRFISVYAAHTGITNTTELMAYLADVAQDLALGIPDGIGDQIAMVWAVAMAVDPASVEKAIAAEIWDGAYQPGPTLRRLRQARRVWRLQDVEAKEMGKERREIIRRREAMQQIKVPARSREAEAARRLKTDPDTRFELARRLSAKILGQPQRADKILCPSCGRRSVFYFIKPGQMTSARCSHKNSCGWWGSLYDLARSS